MKVLVEKPLAFLCLFKTISLSTLLTLINKYFKTLNILLGYQSLAVTVWKSHFGSHSLAVTNWHSQFFSQIYSQCSAHIQKRRSQNPITVRLYHFRKVEVKTKIIMTDDNILILLTKIVRETRGAETGFPMRYVQN